MPGRFESGIHWMSTGGRKKYLGCGILMPDRVGRAPAQEAMPGRFESGIHWMSTGGRKKYLGRGISMPDPAGMGREP
jgi:hypothetical protein